MWIKDLLQPNYILSLGYSYFAIENDEIQWIRKAQAFINLKWFFFLNGVSFCSEPNEGKTPAKEIWEEYVESRGWWMAFIMDQSEWSN